MSLEEKILSIRSLNDLLRCISLSSLLELSGYPKPGNVHRMTNFKSTRFEHFLAAISAVQPNFREFCEKICHNLTHFNHDFSFVQLGLFFKNAAKEMMKWQKGGNVILGHLLIQAPLVAAAIICLKTKKIHFSSFTDTVSKVIEDATIEDTINLYDAIKICNPGGLGKVEKYDLNDKNSKKDIQRDYITLKRIFELSKGYDLISWEYSTGFSTILYEGLPYLFDTFNSTKDINIATVNTFFKILSKHPDTLIIRKSGEEAAKIVSNEASLILKKGGIISSEGIDMAKRLDNLLQEREGQMNPGTTADILAGVIFSALIFGLRF